MRPYTPAKRLPKGKKDPAFRTKPQLAGELVDLALEQGVSFRAVVADCAYGDHLEFRDALAEADLPYVLAVKPSTAIWASEEDPHCPAEAVERLLRLGERACVDLDVNAPPGPPPSASSPGP